MKKKILYVILSIVLVSVGCIEKNNNQYIKEKIVDDLGNQLEFDSIPQRVISLAPNLTEMIYDLNFDKYLIGNTLYCNYPEESQKIEKVGDILTFNFEKIVQLKPDLIFITVEGNTKETYDKFKNLGLKLFVSNPRDYEGIKKSYNDIAKIFGVEELSRKRTAQWDSIITIMKNESSILRNSTGAFFIEVKPIMLAGENTYFNEFLEVCGLKNITEGMKINYPIFNREELLKRDPDYIFYPTSPNEKLETVVNSYPEWRQLKAVNNKRFFLVDRDLYSRPGPRFVNAIEDMFSLLHPEKDLHLRIQQ